MSTEIVTLESIIGSVALTFGQVSVDKSIDFRRESEFALQILYGNDFSRKIALANPQSVRDAVTNIAAIGISLNPAKKQAYLVPRKNAICLDISYMGLLDLAIGSGSILWGQAEIVYASDAFVMNGFDKPPTHDRKPFAKDRGEIVGVYSVAKTRDGDYLTSTMSISEVLDIRDRSESWKKGQKGPWATDFNEMAKKGILKRSQKLWPKTDRLDQAIHYLNTDGGQGIDFHEEVITAKPVVDPGFSIGNILARLDAAETHELVADIRREGLTAASRTKDKSAYERIVAAVAGKRAEFEKADVSDIQFREVSK